jgi:arylsulfatase A-like enzyme
MRRPRLLLNVVVLLTASAASFLLAACAADRPPNILLIVIDTLRADAIGVYGGQWNSTPFLDAFAAEGIVFENAFAPTPMTAPSHASLFTSTHPASHGIWNEIHLDGERSVFPRLPPSAITLAEVLNDAGYETVAIADGGWVVEGRGFDQGFEHFDSRSRGVVDRVRTAMSWLARREDDRPFFLFLHTYEVHAPYLPPPRYEAAFAGGYDGRLRDVVRKARAFAASGGVKNKLVDVHERFFQPLLHELDPEEAKFLRALYQAELALVDAQLARLVGSLRESGVLDDTIVVITSDHGEEFGEHGLFGHGQVYRETLHIPLIVRSATLPAGVRRTEPVTLVDVMPSLLSHLGVSVPASAVGRIVNLREANAAPADRPLVGETLWKQNRQVALQRGEMKAIFFYGPHSTEPVSTQVFDYGADPGEQRSISSSELGAEFLERSQNALRLWFEEALRHREEHGLHGVHRRLEDFQERMEELRALGYVGD